MKFSFASLFTKLTLATSVASALVGCDEPKYPEPKPVTESTVGRANVLVVNAAPGATGTVVTVDNAAFGTALPYLGASAVTPVNAGQRLFLFREPTNIPSNAAAGSAARDVVSRSAFVGNTNYTTFLTDQPNRAIPANQTADQGGIRTLALATTIAAPANAANARIRFINLAPSGSYGIYNSVTQASLFSSAPTRAYRAVNNGTATPAVNYANFTDVAAGTYTLDARTSATGIVVGSQGTFTFVAGKSYTLYVRGIAGNPTTPLGISVVQHN